MATDVAFIHILRALMRGKSFVDMLIYQSCLRQMLGEVRIFARTTFHFSRVARKLTMLMLYRKVPIRAIGSQFPVLALGSQE